MFNHYVYLILYFTSFLVYAEQLNEYIEQYDRLSYDPRVLDVAHKRARRSVSAMNPLGDDVQFRFRAFGNLFRIRLFRDRDVFHDRLHVEGPNNQPLHVDTAHIYKGHVIGDPNSYVFGSVIDGVFEGKIVTSRGAFYIEKAHHYFGDQTNKLKNTAQTNVRLANQTVHLTMRLLNNRNITANDQSDTIDEEATNQSFHSVIYNENDVKWPHKHGVSCAGVDENIINWMQQIQLSADDDQNLIAQTNNTRHVENIVINATHHPHYNKYSREANQRQKRATPRENKNTCSLFIQTDPLIWRHIRESFPDHRDPHKKVEVDEKTREEILSLIAHHVTAVNYIYRDTKFDGKTEHRNIKFEVQRIKIDDDSACSGYPYQGESNPFCMENIDVSNFLNLHSLGNHEDFCLAYVFTYRDFTGGTLGLAWVASASGASGGICEKYKTYTETVAGMYQSTKRSLNTGIITFVNYNSRVPPKVSQLTLAHEIGHNFGSPHDYPSECRPGGLNGNFIMFASATSGDRPNNSKFSHCSVGNISAVLDAIEDNKKRNCFSANSGAFCGNKIVEAGEECDCGYDDDECTDPCCYPRVVSELDHKRNESAKGCHRRYGTQCSPSQGPCCQSTCRFTPAGYNTCKTETDCSHTSTCNGMSAECPAPRARRDKTRCNNGTQLCIAGECSGSICLEWNLTECFLTSTLIPNISKRKLCELACQNGSDPGSCRSTSEFASYVGLPPGGISLRPGSPCDNFQGYCDVFYRCRAVDTEGPLVRLKKLLLNKETLSSVALWATDYWWAVVLMSVAFIIFMGVIIKCCAVHTPSSNPKKAPARRISDTLRRPMNTLRRMHRHHNARPVPLGPTGPPPGTSRGGGGASAHAGRRHDNSSQYRQAPPPHGARPQHNQYYAPNKASAPPTNYSRINYPSGGGGGDMYAGAYEMNRQQKV